MKGLHNIYILLNAPCCCDISENSVLVTFMYKTLEIEKLANISKHKNA